MRRLAIVLGVLVAAALPDVSQAAPQITMRWTGGLGGGLSANRHPQDIARGPGDVMWFTAWADPGVVARATNGVNELLGGATPGFTANARPTGIAQGPDGNMWFTEIANPGRVGRVTPLGQFTEFPAGPTANASPTAITAGPDGNIWFVKASGPGYVVRMSPQGVATAELVGGVTPGFTANALPSGIAAGPDGNVWFSTAATHRIGIIEPATLRVTELAAGTTPGLSPNLGFQDITAGPDGAMWATAAGGGGRIVRITTDRQVTEFPVGLPAPTGIAAGPDGNLWYAKTGNPGAIGRITPEGAVTEFTPTNTPSLPANAFPVSLAAGYDGAMWFTLGTDPGRIGHVTVGPGVRTGTATDVRDTSVRLRGTVTPNGQETTYRFEYGRTTAYGSRTQSLGADDGVTPRDVAQTVRGLRPDTTYHYRLIATNGSDTTPGADGTFTTGRPGEAGSAGPVSARGPAALRRLRLTPRTFRAARRGGSVGTLRARRGRRAAGTVVSYRLDRAARVRFTVLRCANRRCSRTRALGGGFTRASRVGANRLRFTGRLRGRRLAPGRYRLVATPRGGAPRRAGFRIRR